MVMGTSRDKNSVYRKNGPRTRFPFRLPVQVRVRLRVSLEQVERLLKGRATGQNLPLLEPEIFTFGLMISPWMWARQVGLLATANPANLATESEPVGRKPR